MEMTESKVVLRDASEWTAADGKALWWALNEADDLTPVHVGEANCPMCPVSAMFWTAIDKPEIPSNMRAALKSVAAKFDGKSYIEKEIDEWAQAGGPEEEAEQMKDPIVNSDTCGVYASVWNGHVKRLQMISFIISEAKGWWQKSRAFLELIALMHSELSEAAEEYRDGKSFTEIYYKPGCDKPLGIPVELADCVIRIADACSALGIDLTNAIRVKLKYNATRPLRHGGKKA